MTSLKCYYSSIRKGQNYCSFIYWSKKIEEKVWRPQKTNNAKRQKSIKWLWFSLRRIQRIQFEMEVWSRSQSCFTIRRWETSRIVLTWEWLYIQSTGEKQRWQTGCDSNKKDWNRRLDRRNLKQAARDGMMQERLGDRNGLLWPVTGWVKPPKTMDE